MDSLLNQGTGTAAAGVRGWLVLLCAWLVLWQPINLAVAAAEAMVALPIRGWSLAALLVVRVVVTAVGVAAGRALWQRRPGAPGLARVAIVSSALVQLFVYATSIAPNNRVPGDTRFYVMATIAVHGGWFLYLVCSARVRRVFA